MVQQQPLEAQYPVKALIQTEEVKLQFRQKCHMQSLFMDENMFSKVAMTTIFDHQRQIHFSSQNFLINSPEAFQRNQKKITRMGNNLRSKNTHLNNNLKISNSDAQRPCEQGRLPVVVSPVLMQTGTI